MCPFWTLRSSAAQPSCDDAALGLPNQCSATPDRLDGSSFVTFRGGFAPHSSRLTNCSAMRGLSSLDTPAAGDVRDPSMLQCSKRVKPG